MSNVSLGTILSRIDALPRLPGAALRAIDVLQQPDAKLREIVNVVRYDQSLTVELMRICNSAYFARSRKIASLDEAVVCLGTVTIMQLVLVAHSRVLMAPEQAGYGLRPGALWRHSVAVALACARLGAGLPQTQRGALFTAGLLHDIGKLLLNEAISDHYAAIAARVAQQHIAFPQAEKQVLGFTHAEVGAEVSRRWGLPDSITRCIAFHHGPAAMAEPDPLVDRVHVADVACLLMGIGGGDDGARYRPDIGALKRIGLNSDGVERLGLETVMAVKKVESACTGRAA